MNIRKLVFPIMAAAALVMSGCATNQSGQQVPDVALMKTVSKSAAYVGSRIWLDEHPEDRAIFVQVQLGLKTLIAAGTFSAADLTALLQQLPVKRLQGETGAIIVDTAVVLWDEYGRQLVDLDKAQVFSTYILPVAKSISEGLDMALATPKS